MDKYLNDRRYHAMIKDILDNEEFKSMDSIIHHGANRYDHSLRVSYYSYLIAKFFKLDTEKVARAALLHDFFFEDNIVANKKQKTKTMLKHPEYALENASKHFELSDLEKDIILTHMFPIGPRVPKYIESWMVDIIDDIVSIYERTYVVRRQLSMASTFLVLFLVNNLR